VNIGGKIIILKEHAIAMIQKLILDFQNDLLNMHFTIDLLIF